MNRILFALLFFVLGILLNTQNTSILIKAESFAKKIGWEGDPQSVEQMRSTFLLAYGKGKPVKVMKLH